MRLAARLLRRTGAALARLRALAQRRRRVTIGTNSRFGRHVRCRVQGDGRIVLGRNVEIAPWTTITAGPGAAVIVGDDVFIGPHCQLAASGRIEVGAGCMFAELVTVRDHDHDPAHAPRSGRMVQADIAVGARVWIGAKASVGRGVTIGDDTVVGAHAFVNRPLPGNALAVGVPARVTRTPIKTSS